MENTVAAYHEREFLRGPLVSAVDELTEWESKIFVTRRMNEEKATLGKQGQLFQISPERVPQIEHSVFAKIQKIVVEKHQRVTNSVF